jgi:hypothetical protein
MLNVSLKVKAYIIKHETIVQTTFANKMQTERKSHSQFQPHVYLKMVSTVHYTKSHSQHILYLTVHFRLFLRYIFNTYVTFYTVLESKFQLLCLIREESNRLTLISKEKLTHSDLGRLSI